MFRPDLLGRLPYRISLWLALVLFLVHRFWEWRGQPPLWMAHYLDPLLAMPLSLSLALAVERLFIYRNPHYRLHWGHVVFAVLLFGFVFEYWLPPNDARMHADPWDVVGYAIGGLWFYALINRR